MSRFNRRTEALECKNNGELPGSTSYLKVKVRQPEWEQLRHPVTLLHLQKMQQLFCHYMVWCINCRWSDLWQLHHLAIVIQSLNSNGPNCSSRKRDFCTPLPVLLLKTMWQTSSWWTACPRCNIPSSGLVNLERTSQVRTGRWWPWKWNKELPNLTCT